MLNILIVDDEYLIRELIAGYLAPYQDRFRVVGKAAGAKEALELLEYRQPDIVLTDINMPVVDGLSMAETILKRYPRIQVIILSVYDEFQYAQRGIRLGVFDYLLKPVDQTQLLQVLTAAGEERNRRLAEEIVGREEEGEDLVTRVEEYLRKNLSDPGLSLKGTAEAFFVNASYLSRVFKQKKGVTFSDYLASLRMLVVRELLKSSGRKVYEICEQVGIQDPNYLSALFKKQMGVSITDYKNSLKSD